MIRIMGQGRAYMQQHTETHASYGKKGFNVTADDINLRFYPKSYFFILKKFGLFYWTYVNYWTIAGQNGFLRNSTSHRIKADAGN